ncbi:MAG: cyclodeaminase/cyclohydrolase family protein [Sphingobium sp.]|uniref:cyclodeaminase/cyclohydrolase family protein n=1 Tax=Sphingobium sp. TaxID=1912891 RepID=UPI0029B69373|nr:cyclodeaminase/cyclohydrolase family protein [Sphingobium sp.]MDX3909822.1 cyclodeaminase/cyclohydrolase family protein [Sphingobium sp.]
MTIIASQSISGFLADLSSTSSSPGSGAAAAVTLSTAAALARKALAITLKHDPENQRLVEADRQLLGIVEAALAGADEDSALFADLIAMQQAEPVQSGDVDLQARRLVELAERLIGLGAELTALVRSVSDDVSETMKNDVLAALALCESATLILRANATENARLVGNSAHIG